MTVSDFPSTYINAVSSLLWPLSRKHFTISRLCSASARSPNAIDPSTETGRLSWDEDMFRRATNLGNCTSTSLMLTWLCRRVHSLTVVTTHCMLQINSDSCNTTEGKGRAGIKEASWSYLTCLKRRMCCSTNWISALFPWVCVCVFKAVQRSLSVATSCSFRYEILFVASRVGHLSY